jgi:hypothetical protein
LITEHSFQIKNNELEQSFRYCENILGRGFKCCQTGRLRANGHLLYFAILHPSSGGFRVAEKNEYLNGHAIYTSTVLNPKPPESTILVLASLSMKIPEIRISKGLKYTGGAIIVVLIVVMLVASPLAKYYLEKYDKDLFGRDATIGWAYVNPFTGYVHLHDVKIY